MHLVLSFVYSSVVDVFHLLEFKLYEKRAIFFTDISLVPRPMFGIRITKYLLNE